MDQNKKSKLGTYYSELYKKSGLIVPAFGALAMFAGLFYVSFIDLLSHFSQENKLGFWLVIVFALLGICCMIAFIATKLKRKGIGAQDTLLLMIDLLMLDLLFGLVIFDFVSLNTVYYAIALVAAVVLTALRIKFSDVEVTEVKEKLPANATTQKYFETVIGKYNFWVFFIVGLAIVGALVLSDIWNFPSLFLTEVGYTVGMLLVGFMTSAIFVYSFIRRLNTRDINSLDGILMLGLFTLVIYLVALIIEFTVIKFAIWLMALCVVITLIRTLVFHTRIDESATDDTYFVTDRNKKYVKNPKIYFKYFNLNFDLFALGAIAFIVLAILSACVSADFLGWAAANGFMFYTVIALLIFAIVGLSYLGKNLKAKMIGKYDALLAVLDVALLLLTITIFGNFESGVISSLVLWAIGLVICLAFSITRIFMVREIKEEDAAVEAAEPAQIEMSEIESESPDEPVQDETKKN